jgi:hypothetical protein
LDFFCSHLTGLRKLSLRNLNQRHESPGIKGCKSATATLIHHFCPGWFLIEENFDNSANNMRPPYVSLFDFIQM